MNYVRFRVFFLALTGGWSLAFAAEPVDWHKTALRSPQPDDEVLSLTVGDAKQPNVLERWWHGKRVRWIDEHGTLQHGDLRGDAVNGLLQIDMDGDGVYDGPDDMNIKWCDTNGDGIPDVQAIVVNPTKWGVTKQEQTGHPVWMLFINHDKHGVLGWIDWEKFNFHCWDFTGMCNWLPNYHGNNDFVKTHAPAYAFNDPRLNWENPFSFYDETGNGVSNMAIRWCAPQPVKNGKVEIPPVVDSAFVTMDIDGSAAKGNETSYDLTLHGAGGKVDISGMVHPLNNFAGDAKFDPLFYHNEWRHIKEVIYMDRNKGYDTFFQTKWQTMYFTFDEDGDDHRWERVEMMYPTTNYRPDGPPVDLYSTARFKNKKGGMDGAFQSDTLGDRGEFDLTNKGGGKLYIGNFDRKLHLYGADWGAWTVDREGKYHGGAGEPTKKPEATKVGEVVKYTDTDGDGFIDLIEYDYDGDRKIDLKVDLKEYKTKDGKPAQVAEIIDPAPLGWKGMHELFNKMAQQGWVEALEVYRAAWKRDLTTPEMDKLAAASSLMQRYQNGYWLKELVFREIRARLLAAKTPAADKLLHDYIAAYYSGDFEAVVKLIGQVPAAKRE
ncbi:MAG: hypothetical protein LBH01_04170 [Verrucomicrobiales bacterium]|jgi:hypothetical protein|nr:hypothetical protein [Verrucomicrobiales bacterium]